MSASAYDPQSARNLPLRPARELQPAAADALQRDLLESVLRETLSSATDPDGLTAADLAALQEVARCRRGQRFDLEPIAIEMVEAVLRDEFEPLASSREAWQAMTTSIARTLCDDPISRDRLEALWNRLSEVAP